MWRARIAALLAIGIGLAGVLWTRFAGDPCARPNVVLIVLDAAGARHFGAYGGDPATTPEFDAFAKEATLFLRAYAQAPTTIVSMSSLLTGKYAPFVPADGVAYRAADEMSIAEVLAGDGYATAAFSQNPWVSETFGFDRGFDTFEVETSKWAESPETAPIVAAATRWLSDDPGRPFFLYLHLLAPHAPYAPPAPFAGRFGFDGSVRTDGGRLLEHQQGSRPLTAEDVGRLARAYRENLAFADAQLGSILDRLREQDLFGDTLVIVTADHGEAFLEHGRIAHATTLYEEMVRVPLAVHWPACQGAAPAQWAPVTEVRTLHRMIADATTRGVVGRAPGPRGGLARAMVYDPFRKKVLRSVTRDDGYKLIAATDGTIELYALKDDPEERHDVSGERPEIVVELAGRLVPDDAAFAATAPPKALDTTTKARLRALGYAADGPPGRD